MSNENPVYHLEQKVVRLENQINGDGKDRPGLAHDVREIRHTIYGNGEKMGLVTKTTIMWRVHASLLALGGGIIGYGIKAAVDSWMKKGI